MSISADKEKAVESAMFQIERQFGKGSIMKLGDSPVIKVPVIPTGSLALDAALGIGGLPRGRVNHRVSMEADINAGNPSEIGFLNGKIVEYGEIAGIPTPYNKIFVSLIKGCELPPVNRD